MEIGKEWLAPKNETIYEGNNKMNKYRNTYDFMFRNVVYWTKHLALKNNA